MEEQVNVDGLHKRGHPVKVFQGKTLHYAPLARYGAEDVDLTLHRASGAHNFADFVRNSICR
uniref:Uncharacterized protein n=1 Tax=Physcomitrium patens TaxID=3218 RepID=A0A7I3ZM51_PHYPA